MEESTTPPSSGNGANPVTVHDAASQFLGLMNDEESKDQPESSEEIAQETEAPSQSELQLTESEAEAETEIPEETLESDEERLYEIAVGGNTHNVTLDELKKGYLREQNYTHKTQRLSEDRKQLEAEQAKAAEALNLRDAYAQKLGAVEKLLQNATQPNAEDLEKLKSSDPIRYAVKIAEQQQRDKLISEARAEQDKIAQQQQAEYQQQLSQHVAVEAQKLAEVIPDYADEQKGSAVRTELMDYGRSIGFSDDELAQAYDSRAVMTLWKASQYDKLMKTKPEVRKKVKAAPKMLKSGVAQGTHKDVERSKKLKGRLRKSGHQRDAAAVFESMLED